MKIFRIIILFIALKTACVNAQSGLMFNSNDSIIDKRTSYNVFQYQQPIFKNHLVVSFDLSVWDKQNLGYIFNLMTGNNSYSLNYLYNQNSAQLNFNINSKSNKLTIKLDSSVLRQQNWLNIKFDFDLKNNTALVYINHHEYSINDLGIPNPVQPELIFGKSQFYTEVPHMSIKNLSVGDGSRTYFFPLNEWSGNEVYTIKHEKIGLVENPIWLINKSFYWHLTYNQTFNQVKGLNFDPLTHKLFIYGKDSIILFDSTDKSTSSFGYKNHLPIQLILGKNIFNSKENKLYAYEVYNDNKSAISMASLDMKTLLWESIGKAKLSEQRHHHNVFYSSNMDSIYIFGGYGGFAYHNAFYTYNRKSDDWTAVPFTGDTITPRFFSASGISDSAGEIFIFGGYGNKSGNQIVGGRQYYDLYRINLQSRTIKKCWEIRPKEIFVPANDLVLSEDKQYFYALCYPHETFKTSLKLYRFSIKDGSYGIVSAPIPVTSERIETDINLFLDKAANQLLCTVQEFLSPTVCNIKVYSLAFPPVAYGASAADTSVPTNSDFLSKREIILWIAGLILGVAIAAVYLRRRKKKISSLVIEDTEHQNESLPIETDIIPIQKEVTTPKLNAVYLLGDFEAYDRKGINITHLFSPKIKQLFVLILLNTRNRAGITSKKISSSLWPERETTDTKNIRSVTFNHLRSIITHIDGLELVFSEGAYFFDFNEAVFCDYYQVINEINKNLPEAEIAPDCFSLMMRGTLLNDMNNSWLDDFKSAYGKQALEFLIPKLEGLYYKNEYPVVLSFCNLILNIDPFNDIALKYEISCCKKMKGIEFCKKIYDKFIQNYQKSLGESFSYSFEDMFL